MTFGERGGIGRGYIQHWGIGTVPFRFDAMAICSILFVHNFGRRHGIRWNRVIYGRTTLTCGDKEN